MRDHVSLDIMFYNALSSFGDLFMNERIRELRKELHLTQQEFADRLGIPRNNIAGYETGKRSPSEAAISLICREFKVSEEWLRTGKGKTFIPNSNSAIDLLSKEFGLTPKEAILIEKFTSLNSEQRDAIVQYMTLVSKELKKK